MAFPQNALLGTGQLVGALGQPTTYDFAWAGTAPTGSAGSALTLTSFASAWAANTAYKVGDAVVGHDGAAWGCVVQGTSAASGTGPATSSATGPVVNLLSKVSIPSYLDGTTLAWIRLSGPSVLQSVVVTNRDASNLLDVSSTANVTAGKGTPIGLGIGLPAWSWDGAAPETLYAIAASGLSFSVTVLV